MSYGRFLESRRGPFGDLQRDINELFDSLLPGFGQGLFSRAVPPVNVSEDADALLVECELPGVDQDRLEVSITGDVLTVKGERPALEPGEGTTVHIRERTYGAFSRAITLPAAIDSDRVEARYDSGILMIRVPKAPEAKSKQVAVHTE